jgi:myo-inositol-hexaphosphate 3-phosphohydrolase
MLKQQRLGDWECYNSGVIYAATHGRGFWQANNYYSPLNVGIPQIASGNKGPDKTVKIFPNPANNFTTVNFNLNDDRKISISVYDLKGSKIKTVVCGRLNKGPQYINLELDGISLGTYIVAVSDEDNVLGTCRFVKID